MTPKRVWVFRTENKHGLSKPKRTRDRLRNLSRPQRGQILNDLLWHQQNKLVKRKDTFKSGAKAYRGRDDRLGEGVPKVCNQDLNVLYPKRKNFSIYPASRFRRLLETRDSWPFPMLPFSKWELWFCDSVSVAPLNTESRGMHWPWFLHPVLLPSQENTAPDHM